MKLHRVEVENLNSLYGKQALDLDTQLAEAPLFLIHGRTGAGKSTLLDAVCLALFGQTPRLGKGRGDEDQDPRQIMSRGTGRCSSAVEFSLRLQEGRRRYRATWTCWRAREKAGEALQQPVRKLEVLQIDARGASSWQVLIESRLEKDYKPHFDHALLGLTVEDFKRSILLAQGEFAAFLRASETERSNMLERLTDTSQYASIGRRAGEVYRQKRQAQEKLRDRLGQIPVLSDADAEAARADLLAVDAEIVELTRRTDHLERGIRWSEEQARQVDALRAASEALEQAERDREAARPDLERLAKDAACQPVAELWSAVQRDERDLLPVARRIDEGSARLGEMDTALASQETEVGLAAGALQRAVVAMQEAAPRIQEARALRLAASSAVKEAGSAERETAAAAKLLVELQEAAAAARQALEERTRDWQAARGRLTATADAEAIADQVRVWQASVETIAAQLTTLKGREKALKEFLQVQVEKRAEAELAARAIDEARSALAPLTEARDAARERLSRVLGEHADVRQARDVRERRRTQTEGQIRAVERLTAPMQAVERTAATWTALHVEHEETRAEVVEQQRSLPQLEAVEQARAEQRSSADEVLRARRLVLDLVSRRDALRGGEPCPLCGSLEHPWRGQPLDPAAEQAVADAEREVLAVDAALGSARTVLTTTTANAARLVAQLEKQAPKLQVARREFEAAVRGLDEAVRLAGIGRRVDDLERAQAADVIADLRARCLSLRADLDEQLTQAREALVALDQADADARAAETRCSTAGERLHALERDRDRAQAEAERAADAVAREEQARAELVLEADQARGALISALRQAGLSPREGELRAAVQDAAQRVEAWRAACKAEQSAREGVRAAEVQRAAAESGLMSVEDRAQDRKRNTEIRRAEAMEASNRAEAALEGHHPDAVEAAHAARQKQAETAHQTAQEALAQTRQALAALRGQLHADTGRREELQTRLAANRSALGVQLVRLEIPDLEALVTRLLSPEQRRAIAELERSLHVTMTAAEARRTDVRAALHLHEAAQPEGAPADGASLAAAREEVGGWRDRHAEVLQKKGALQEKLAQHEQNLRRVGTLAAELEGATRELAIWEHIYDLIGVGNGDAFKKYAQILNLEDLLQRSNERLRWLAPRYLLVPAKGPSGEERLAFAVQDEHHAWEARPLTTLSGGETFLVSLALALALAEYRTLQAPIETLLLDEGFGTLDTDTLNTVMDALEKLQSRGARVGLISHVEALRERIEARIAVESVGHGRSRLRVELGAGLRVA